VNLAEVAPAPRAAPRERVELKVRGRVQGVGFRPYAYRQAAAFGLAGWVVNTPQGATLEVEGPPDAVAGFVDALTSELPAPATIDRIEKRTLPPTGESGFTIRESALAGDRSATVLPDIATCEECLAEIADPANRRHRYPFTNCTHCGPRYSIIADLPYDRARTTMAGFVMCADCRAEYEDASDRRFHAEPNACPRCGPQLALRDTSGVALAIGDDALSTAADAIRDGKIVAVKGLGGFHLMVDARNEDAVARLRQHKNREEKPFAVMFLSMAAIEAVADVSPVEATLLESRERPIVLVRKRRDTLAYTVAPGNPLVGAILPYTPLHHLLLGDLGFPVVATSGNRSDEPIVTDETEALARLSGIADVFLVHDRPIVRPVDDSVARVVAGRPMLLRRARGYAPSPIAVVLPPGILAAGGHLKATVALTTEAGVVISQHLGDLDAVEARDAYDRAIADLTRLHATEPNRVGRDLHPDYHSTRAAERLGAPVVAVQHHLAHVASCMAEHGLGPPLLGVAWDGTGDGGDGTVWGGEFLRVAEDGWHRVVHLRPFRLPGGEAAVREPRRAAFSLLHEIFGRNALEMTDLAPIAAFTAKERATLAAMIDRGLNAPVTTSAGRLFDAVAALLGLRQRSTYEGQAAMELEWAAETANATAKPLAFLLRAGAPPILDWEPVVRAILADRAAGVATGEIAAAFHRGLALAIAEVAATIGEETVVLTGGCFQNAVLTEATVAALRAAGATPVWHEQVPPNDGGLALGQAYWAARYVGDD